MRWYLVAETKQKNFGYFQKNTDFEFFQKFLKLCTKLYQEPFIYSKRTWGFPPSTNIKTIAVVLFCKLSKNTTKILYFKIFERNTQFLRAHPRCCHQIARIFKFFLGGFSICSPIFQVVGTVYFAVSYIISQGLVVQLGPILKSSAQVLAQSRTLKCLSTPPPTTTTHHT